MIGVIDPWMSQGKSVQISNAENGLIVTTVVREMVDDPQHAMHGDPALPPKQVEASVPKTHVFDNIDDALRFVRKYLEGK